MFERFTNRARAVLVLAQDEARELDHNFIGTEHLLLGVIGSNDDVVIQALAGYDFTLEDVRERVVAIVGPGDEEVVGQPPFTPRAKKVLELSLREALAMGHNHIGVAHILLGILREGDGVGAKVLEELGVDADRVRLWIGQLMGESEPMGRGRRSRRGRMRDVERSTRPVPTHSTLLALIDDTDSMAGKVLADLGVTKDTVEAKVAEIGLENTSDAPPKPRGPTKRVALTDGVEIRITDPELGALVDSGDVAELLKQIVSRAKSA